MTPTSANMLPLMATTARIVIFMLAAIFSVVQSAQAKELRLGPEDRLDNILLEMVVVAGQDMDIDDPAARAQARAAAETSPQKWQRGTEHGTWMYLRLVNTSDRPGIWRLDTEQSTATGIHIYAVNEDLPRAVLSAGYPMPPMDDRDAGGLFVASAPITAPPGGSVELFARLDYGDIPDWLVLQLEPESEFVAERVSVSAWDAAYFGAGAAMFVFFVAFSILLRSRPGRWYAVFFAMLITLQLHVRGYLALFLFPDLPDLVAELTRFIQLAAVSSYLLFVRSFLEAPVNHPRFNRAIWVVIVFAAALTLAEWIHFQVIYIHLAFGVALVFAVMCVLGAVFALRSRTPGAGLFAGGVGLLFAYVFAGLALFYVLPSEYIAQVQRFTLIAQLADGGVFAAAVVRQTFGLRRQRDDAIAAELAVSREKLQLSEALLAAHQDRDEAQRLAARHRERLALTSHDLRQPLASLKIALSDLDRTDPVLGDKMRAGVDYLNSILTENLDRTRPEGVDEPATPESAAEQIPVQVLLDNAARMFAEEAREKGLNLRVGKTSTIVTGDVVSLIRMLGNLVSNAVKYTRHGGILLGARRRGETVDLQVWDTGPGLTPDEIAAVRQSYRRGDAKEHPEGEGIGLTSVHELAVTNDLHLEIRSRPGHGSTFAITGLPMALE